MIDGVHDYGDEYMIGRAEETDCSQPAATTPSPSKMASPPPYPIGHPPAAPSAFGHTSFRTHHHSRSWSPSCPCRPLRLPSPHAHPQSHRKSLKVVDLKDLLNKAGTPIPSKANKQDLINKILATPAAVDVYNQQHGGAPAQTTSKPASKAQEKPQAVRSIPSPLNSC